MLRLAAPHGQRARRAYLTPFLPMLALLGVAGCAGAAPLHPAYARSQVEPVTVSRVADDAIAIRYRVPPESLQYSPGVDYEKDGDRLRIFIVRCRIGNACEPMAKSTVPLDQRWSAEVRIPYHLEQVRLISVGEDTPIYP